MTATTTITCTKSEFSKRLFEAFIAPVRDTERDTGELNEVICGLVVQANGHQGMFSGHSAYLNLDFTVHPDEPALVELFQCDEHAITASAQCCPEAVPMGAYRRDEPVACAGCEEDMRDPRRSAGLAFGRVGSSGPLCTWCASHGHPRDLPCDTDCVVKCADCDAPAVRSSAPEYSPGVDTSPKPRCERHARPSAQGALGEQLNAAQAARAAFLAWRGTPTLMRLVAHTAKANANYYTTIKAKAVRQRMLLEALAVEMPERSRTERIEWLNYRLARGCRNCGELIRRDGEGRWVHEADSLGVELASCLPSDAKIFDVATPFN